MEQPVSTITAMSPVVSVCIITYNQASYISQAIESVLMQQTDFLFEIIISEDCGTDETREICKRYANMYPDKIRLLLPEKNLGICDNFYHTMFSALGRYISFCEGDDYWIDPLKLQKQFDYLEAYPTVGCVYTDFCWLHQRTGEMEKSLFQSSPDSFPLHTELESFIVTPLYLAPCTWMLRRELLARPSFKTIDATFTLFAHMLSQNNIHFMPETTAVYRDLPESASHSASLPKLYERYLGVYTAQILLSEQYKLSETARKQIDENFFSSNLQMIIAFAESDILVKAWKVLRKKDLRLRFRLRLLMARMRIGQLYARKRYEASLRRKGLL